MKLKSKYNQIDDFNEIFSYEDEKIFRKITETKQFSESSPCYMVRSSIISQS